MHEYPKIHSLYKRDEKGRMILGDWSREEFCYLRDNSWMFTEKVDGTNVRVMWDGEKVRFGGKTDNAQMPVFLMECLLQLFTAEKVGAVFGAESTSSACLYGEGYGARIQRGGGHYKPDGVDFVLFDVKVGDWWLKREDMDDVAAKLGIASVPIVGDGMLCGLENYVASKPQSSWGDFPMEGVVARPLVDLRDRAGNRIITKLKVRDFTSAIPRGII